jgi:SAM-dependent methyltransferase
MITELLQIVALATSGGLFLLFTYTFCTMLVLPFTRGALFVPTSRVRVRAILDAVPMTENQLLVDLGCGDGRMLREAELRYGVRGIGYELNPFAYLIARLNCFRLQDVTIRMCNFWNVDLGEADVVFCYLFPDVLQDLAQKLVREAKPGAVLVSCNFPLPGMTKERILHPNSSLHNDPIYIYRVPAAIEPDGRIRAGR